MPMMAEQSLQFRILKWFLGLAADHWRPGLRVTPPRYSSNVTGEAISALPVVDRAAVKSMVRGSSIRVGLFLP